MYYFSEKNYRGNHAGTKARNDVETIARQCGAVPINAKPFILRSDNKDSHIYSNVTTRFDLARYFFDLWKVRRQFVLVQYPMLAFDFEEDYFKAIAKRNKLVLLVHDIHSLRMPNREKLKREIALLNMADTVIVHNHFMERKLRNLGLTVSSVISLEIFDYLWNGTKPVREIMEKSAVCFAGNLEKSRFLPNLLETNPRVKFNLYGSGLNDELLKYGNAKYCGSYSPDEIPEKLEAKYGLVWDGDSVTDCTGVLGEYTKINNPHKLSLYLASGIPVIVWSKAAAAEYVATHGVGITVDRVDKLDKVLSGITNQEYSQMIDKVKEVQSQITAGNKLRNILQQIESKREIR